MQKKNAGIARNFALKGLLLLAALTLSTGFFACKVAVGGGDGGGTEAPQVTLTFDAGEGSFKEGKTLTLTGKAGENLALPETPVKEGYDLTGWNPALPEKYPEKDTEYTAVWVKEWDYTITYVNVDGATNENPAGYNVETETIILKDPEKPGYTFGGWYRAEDFTGEAVIKIAQGSTGNITLYAKWIEVIVPETLELAGGKAPLGESGTEVTLSDFYIGKYEVTFEEYESVMIGNKNGIGIDDPCESKREPAWTDVWGRAIVYCNRLSINQGLKPCYTVDGSTNPDDWGEKFYTNYINNVICDFSANGYRLPTEAEWEYAARGGQEGLRIAKEKNDTPNSTEHPDGSYYCTYSGSDDIGKVACYSENCTNFDEYGEHYPEEVGLKSANALGLYDMSGNVMEWCWDWDNEIFPYTGTGSGEIKNPAGPESGTERVIRGGCSGAEKEQCTVSYRDYHGNSIYEANGANYGFRVVRSIR